MKTNSEILSHMLRRFYPMIIVFGFYIIINGHNSPGGGFQGGAVLSTVFITRYLVYPRANFSMKSFQLIEKIIFLCILGIPIFYIFNGLFYPTLHNLYYIIMNLLIGIKVCCGLTVIFFRFVFYEGR